MSRKSRARQLATAHRLSRQLRAIATEAASRRRQKGLSPVEAHLGYIKRAVYSLVKERISDTPSLTEMLDDLGEPKVRRSVVGANPFYRVLKAIETRGYALVAVDRRRVALELEYARRHDVPVELLVGFLLQTSAKLDLSRRVNDASCFEDVLLTFGPTAKRLEALER